VLVYQWDEFRLVKLVYSEREREREKERERERERKSIWPWATFVILDNLGWYCDVANIFIHQQQIQIAPWNNHN
jgi:hypothetical protein